MTNAYGSADAFRRTRHLSHSAESKDLYLLSGNGHNAAREGHLELLRDPFSGNSGTYVVEETSARFSVEIIAIGLGCCRQRAGAALHICRCDTSGARHRTAESAQSRLERAHIAFGPQMHFS